MIVLNHCGVTNAVYYSSRFPQPYAIPLDLEGSVKIDYQPAAVDFANFSSAVQFIVDQDRRKRELYVWQDEYARINTISHVITIDDKLAGKATVFLNGLSEWRNWALVYLPSAIYNASPADIFSPPFVDSPRYRRGYDNRPNHRFSGGPYCWRIYYGCNFCGAYSSQSRLREFRFSKEDGVNGCEEFYFVSPPSSKCPECGRVSLASSKPGAAERLGKSDNIISCRFDRIKLHYYYHWLTRDDVAWLTDVSSLVPFMGTFGQGLSVPFDVSLYGTTHTNNDIPGYKTKALLRKATTLSSYYDIPSHWLSQTGIDWAKALNPFQRPDPWANQSPSFPLPPSESGQPGSGPMDQDRASQSGDATADPTGDPPERGPSPPLSTRGIAPSPGPQEEEGGGHPTPGPPPPSPLPDDGVSFDALSDARRRSLRRSIRLFGGRGKC